MTSWGHEIPRFGVGLLGTFICLEKGRMNMIISFIYYLLVRVSGTTEGTEGPREDRSHESQEVSCEKWERMGIKRERQSWESRRSHGEMVIVRPARSQVAALFYVARPQCLHRGRRSEPYRTRH